MRRQLSALAICVAALVLVAARCSRDEDDGTSFGVYPKVEGEEFGAGAAVPPDDNELTQDPPPSGGVEAAAPKAGGSAKEPADDLFADPLDGADAKVDGNTMLDDQSTFEPGGSGLPSVVGPDGDSLPQIPGPDGDSSELGGAFNPDLTD